MFKRILVLIDEQPASMQAIRQGVEVARVNGGEIFFFHLLPSFDALPIAMHEAAVPRSLDYEREIRCDASEILKTASNMAEAVGVLSISSMGSGGSKSDAHCVADIAEKRRCELIVVATDCRNALVRLVGRSIVPGLISIAKMPVLVCQFGDPSSTSPRRKARMPNARRVPAPSGAFGESPHAINE